MSISKRVSSFAASARSFLAAQNYFAILLIILAVIAIRLPIDYKRMMTITDNDYTTHIFYALDMLHHRPVPAFTLAHSFWQLFLIFMWWLSRSHIDFWQSAIGLQVVSSITAALILYFWYGTLPNKPSAWARAFWAVTLVMVTPIIAPTLLDGAYYFGYIGLANYHNPTVHVLRPFALVLFLFGMSAMRTSKHTAWAILFCALVMMGATFLKPSYTITLLPALGLMVLYLLIQRKPEDWPLLIFGLGVPAVLILGAQFVITYIQGETDGGIAFMPFVVAQNMSRFLPTKFLMSIFFPLTISLLFFKKVIRDPEMILAWLSFLIGSAQFYLLAEKGSRFTHANFLWSAEITLFVLFAVTARFLLKQDFSWKRLTQPGFWLQYALYLPHISSGIAYYIFCYTTPHYG